MTADRTTTPPLVLLGAGGHAKVLLALVEAAGMRLRGVCDPALHERGESHWQGIPVLGGDDALAAADPADTPLVNGLGQRVGQDHRSRLFAALRKRGFRFPALVHPAAWVAPTVRLAEGVQVMAGAVVQPDCQIGEDTIVNTGATIDHDCRIGRHAHVAPGATLCGGVTVADGAFVGAGATLIQGVTIGAGAIVGAGTTVVRDLPAGRRILGAPPRIGDVPPPNSSD